MARGVTLVAGGLILWLASSCALWKKNPAKDNADGPGNAGSAQVFGAANGSAPAAGSTSGRLITRATVADSDDPQTPSLGQELVDQALGGTGAAGNEPKAGGNGGGNGVPIAAAERRVGVVRVIGAHGKFVLIETTTGYGGIPLAAGQELRCRGSAAGGGAQTAVLKAALERQPPLLVADVVTGEPHAGDVAYYPIKKRK